MDARDKILETATRLFSTQGYGSTSLSQVAKDARVSKALIFWHFENKERLFQSALQRSLEPYFVNVVGQLEGLDEAEQIHRLIDLFYEFVRQHMQSIRFVLSLILREEKQPDDPVARVGELFRIFRSLLNDILESGRHKGVFRADIDPASEASLIMCALAGALVQRFIGTDFSGESESIVGHLKQAVVDRLRVPES
ncbi:MAG: TetR/AcrR family transcriptional regulator [Deltaproteobacteria bacterium]|nr:TetR/AcrR family transcriptional regulator [Deltaproteobacteria bacterium]